MSLQCRGVFVICTAVSCVKGTPVGISNGIVWDRVLDFREFWSRIYMEYNLQGN